MHRLSFTHSLLVLLAFLLPAVPAQAVTTKFLWGIQAGANWTYTSFADNGGRFGLPVLGFHGMIPLNRRFRIHAYLEQQNFQFDNANTLFTSGGLGNRAYSILVVPNAQILTPPLGSAYFGLGAGLGVNSTFGQNIPWAVAVWGVHIDRKSFFEVRGQFDLSKNTFDNIYFAAVLGIHFNPRDATWKE